jgi:uncharacterized protein (DUF1697 family)
MAQYVVLLRGINVGGRSSLPMKELTGLLEELGCENVRTYIQSGNVVLESSEKAPTLAGKIKAAVKALRGFEPEVLLLTAKELEKAIANNPFPQAEDDPKTVHFGFLASRPVRPDLEKLESLKKESEEFQLIGQVFYLYAPEGVGRSKLAAASEKALGVSMTDRNWNTVCKLQAILENRA